MGGGGGAAGSRTFGGGTGGGGGGGGATVNIGRSCSDCGGCKTRFGMRGDEGPPARSGRMVVVQDRVAAQQH